MHVHILDAQITSHGRPACEVIIVQDQLTAFSQQLFWHALSLADEVVPCHPVPIPALYFNLNIWDKI
jgi:hypothetical protein